MKIVNCTPHEITIIGGNIILDKPKRMYIAEKDFSVIAKIPPSGIILNATIETKEKGNIEGIPVFEKEIIACDEVPKEGDIFVVSALYAVARQKLGECTANLYLVADPVYTPSTQSMRPVGCKGICPAF